MSQSRNIINRELISIISQIQINLVNYQNKRLGTRYDLGKDIHVPVPLTAERKTNISAIQSAITHKLQSIKLDVTKADAIIILNEIEDVLTSGLAANNQLSIKHGYIHKTYEENRLSGHGVFSSWWGKTWTQSHASLALEKSIQQIQKFRSRYVEINEIAVKHTQVKGMTLKH